MSLKISITNVCELLNILLAFDIVEANARRLKGGSYILRSSSQQKFDRLSALTCEGMSDFIRWKFG
jgi:hypothetical protein